MSVNGRGLDITGHQRRRPERDPPTRTVFNDVTPARVVVDDLGVDRRLIIFHIQHGDRLLEEQLVDTETVGKCLSFV